MLALALLVIPAPSGAQQAPQTILDDNTGDVAITAAGVAVPNAGRFAAIDLVSLAMFEDAERIHVQVGVADVSPDPALPGENGQIFAHFSVGETLYRVAYAGTFSARLLVYDAAADRFAQIRQVPLDVDADENTLTAHLLRQDVLDEMGSALHPGLMVQNFYATSYALFGDDCRIQLLDQNAECPVKVGDRMPNDAEPTGEYRPVFGVVQTGHLFLDSDVRARASNGDDTTYVFEVELTNRDHEGDEVLLTIQNAPATWDVRIPADHVVIDGNSTLRLPVLVTTPFAHKHGAFESLLVEAHSERDSEAVGRLELGVRYTEVPQPAGHHDTVWFHSRSFESDFAGQAVVETVFGGTSNAYFNTLQDDDNDAGMDVPADNCGIDVDALGSLPTTRFCWRIYLEPALQMGLDFDVTRTGTVSVPVASTLPLQDAVFSGVLRYRSADAVFRQGPNFDDGSVDLAVIAPSAPESIGAQGSTVFEGELVPTNASELVPFNPVGASMWLEFSVEVTGVSIFGSGVASPVLEPGGTMTLPLNEYQDPVDDLFHSLTDVDIEMTSPQEMLVNPGETGLFELEIVNAGVVNDRFALQLDGTNTQWATILGDQVIDVKAGTSRAIVIAVAPPLGTDDGEQADLILEARSTKDPDARALVRLLAEADLDLDHTDQTPLVQGTDEELTTHTVPAPLGLAAGLVALALRRRLQ